MLTGVIIMMRRHTPWERYVDSAEHQSPGQTPASKNFYFVENYTRQPFFRLLASSDLLFPLTVKSCRLSGWSPVSLPPFKSALPPPRKNSSNPAMSLTDPTDLGLLVHHPHYFIGFLSPIACSRQRSRSYGAN